MKIRTLLSGIALVVCTAVITTQVVSQDAGTGQPEMSPEEMEMMSKWMEYATPGEPHKLLAMKAGKWNFSGKFWHEADTPPMESTGLSNFKMIMDGRFLIDKTESSFGGMPFEGLGITGYDNIKKKFLGVWLDNSGTGMSFFEGEADPTGKVVTSTGEMPDFMIGEYKWCKSIERYVDDNTWTMEMYTKDENGKKWKSMEITYTRAE